MRALGCVKRFRAKSAFRPVRANPDESARDKQLHRHDREHLQWDAVRMGGRAASDNISCAHLRGGSRRHTRPHTTPAFSPPCGCAVRCNAADALSYALIMQNLLTASRSTGFTFFCYNRSLFGAHFFVPFAWFLPLLHPCWWLV